MSRCFGPYAANALTASRVALTPAFVVAACTADRAPLVGVLAVTIFGLIAASDVLDGCLARRWGSDSGAGRVFDHFADVAFILSALSAYAWLRIAPWWVPAAIGLSFCFYVVDSRLRASVGTPSLIGSRIGHAAGVLNYSLVGVLVCNNTAGIHLLSEAALSTLFWCVPLYSAGAVLSRLTGRTAGVPVAPAVTGSD